MAQQYKNRRQTGPQVIVQNTAPRSMKSVMGYPGGNSLRMSTRTNIRGAYAADGNELAKFAGQEVEKVKDARVREKSEIGGLNQKLAERIEKMNFLVAQNKQLTMELEKWKAMKMFDENKIKDIMTAEMEALRADNAELMEKNAELEAAKLKQEDRADTMVEDLAILRKQRDQLNEDKEKLARINDDLEAENAKLRRGIEFSEGRRKLMEEELVGTKDDVLRLRDDLEAARAEQLSDAAKLTDQIELLEYKLACKEKECDEYLENLKHLKSITPDYSGMWESQFKDTLMKLQADCDERINRHIAEITSNYETKLARIQAQAQREKPDTVNKVETKTLKSQVGTLNNSLSDLKRENDSLRRQLEDLQNQFRKQCEECEIEKDELRNEIDKEKASKDDIESCLRDLEKHNSDLTVEISTYRHLVEGLGNEMANQGNYQTYGAAVATDAILGGGRSGGAGGSGSYGGGSSQQSSTMSESTGTLRVKRQSSCAMSIVEISQDGRYVKLSNSSQNKDFDLGEWTLERKHPKGTSTYKFPKGYTVKKGGTCQVWAARFDEDAPDGALIADSSTCKSWGTGNGELSLKDKDKATKASSSMNYELR